MSTPAEISVLRRAEAFITGFEDDATQTGVVNLLADIRSAIAGAVARYGLRVDGVRYTVRSCLTPYEYVVCSPLGHEYRLTKAGAQWRLQATGCCSRIVEVRSVLEGTRL